MFRSALFARLASRLPRRWRLYLVAFGVTGACLAALARAGRAAQRGDLGAQVDLVAVRGALCAQVRPVPIPLPDSEPFGLAAVENLTLGVDIVGLGESTHGTHEFFAFKAAVIRALIEDAGVRTVAFEAPWLGAKSVDRFVRTGDGTARDALATLGFWTWSTAEVAELLEWVRDFNRHRRMTDRVRFVGIDPQMSERVSDPDLAGGSDAMAERDARVRQQAAALRGKPMFWARYRRDAFMAENLLWIARQRAESAPVVVWAHDGHLAKSWPLMGRHLHRQLGSRYRAVALLAGHGSFNAFVKNREGHLVLGSAALASPPERAVEGLLARCGVNGAFVWLDSARRSSPALQEVLKGRLLKRSIGAVVSAESSRQFLPSGVAREFDAIWFSEASTPTRLLPLRGIRMAREDR